MNINSIKPKTPEVSDKYSWGIYKWLKTNGTNFRVLLDPSKDKTLTRRLNFISDEGGRGTIGSNVHSIMTGQRTLYCFSLCPLHKYTDVTDWFWSNYLRFGRCMVDPEHSMWFLSDDGRYTMINKNSKRCNWCGKYFKRDIKKQVSIKRVEHWEEVQ